MTESAGTGTDFGADLFALYRAGQVAFPELAIRYSNATSIAHEQQPILVSEQGRVGGAGASAVARMLGIHHDLQHALQQTSINLRDTGTALVQIADSFAATDAAAQEEFDRLQRENRDVLGSPGQVPTPPAVNDPQPEQHGPGMPGEPF